MSTTTNSGRRLTMNNTTTRRRKKDWVQNLIVLFFAAVTALTMIMLPAHGPTSLLRWTTTVVMGNTVGNDENEEHTLPTLLSVVDDTAGNYVNALENPLYEKLKTATFAYPSTGKVSEIPVDFQLDKRRISLRESLTLSWSPGQGDQTLVQDDDIIVLYCGLSGETTMLDAATVAQAKATSQRHSPSSVSLSNSSWYFPRFPVMRQEECHFKLFRRDDNNTSTTYNYSFLAKSEKLQILDAKDTPTGVHLALSNNIDEIVVQFKTGNKGTPIVKYGLVQDSLIMTATGTSHTYAAKDMCQEPATLEEPGKFQPPGMMHVVTLKHLQANTTYFYQVGIQKEDEPSNNPTTTTTWSDIFSFTSPPETKAGSEAFSYIVYGDQGCPANGWGDGGKWTAAMTTRELQRPTPIRAVHHFGDLSYAKGAAHIWDEWLDMISSFTTSVPLMVAVGNHEYDHTDRQKDGKDPSGETSPNGYHPKWGNYHQDSGGECGVPTANHFKMPKSSNSNGVFWYSFNFANVHTIVLSSEHDVSPGSRQYQWLEEDLKSVDHQLTPWTIVELHRPMYEAEIDINGNTRVGEEIRKRIENLLVDYKVDLVLAGHYHSYLRTCHGVYQGSCDKGGPMHITIGSTGAKLRKFGVLYPNSWTKKFIPKTFGYGRITVANSTALHFEFVQAGDAADPEAGKVLDEVWITKDVTEAVSSLDPRKSTYLRETSRAS